MKGPATASGPTAIVVIPARDEEEHVASAVAALSAQEPASCRPGVVLVDDGSTDDTGEVSRAVLAAAGLPHLVVPGPGAGVGWARRVGFEHAARWARCAGGPGTLLVSTDADSVADPGWIAALHRHAAGGAVVAGDVLPREPAATDPDVARRRTRSAGARLRDVRAVEPDAEHHHFSAANLAMRADVHERVGGWPTPRALEDEALLAALRERGVAVRRTTAAVVRTSGRTAGRVAHGLSVELSVEAWKARRRHAAAAFPVARLAALARRPGAPTVSVVVPAREEAATIGGVLRTTVAPLVQSGVVAEVIVVDRRSADGTGAIAAAHGATVLQRDDVRPDLGPCLGKGDALWRALHVARGDVVAFLDADTADPVPAHLAGILGPLLVDPTVQMVRGAYRRDRLDASGAREVDGGGRVTELCARPLLAVHRPRLTGLRQPLAGEFAARTSLLRRLPFPVGYGVEIATLMDAERLAGLDAIAEVDLGARQNRHRPLRELGPMAFAVLAAVRRRVEPDGVAPTSMRLPWIEAGAVRVPVQERPPLEGAPSSSATGRTSPRPLAVADARQARAATETEAVALRPSGR